jgi:hypothetical protein
MKKIIVVLTVLFAIPLAGYAHAGFFDRHLEMMDVLYAVLKTILVSQILVFLFVRFSRFKITKKLRIRLLLYASVQTALSLMPLLLRSLSYESENTKNIIHHPSPICFYCFRLSMADV